MTRLAISGYLSLRNGVGKSSLYRSTRLLADCAQGRPIRSLVLEGGLQSTLRAWQWPER